MHFNSVKLKLRPEFFLPRLLQSGAFSDLSVNDVARIRWRGLLGARRLLEEIRQFDF